MPTLQVAPLARFTWSFRVSVDGREVTLFELERMRDRGRFELAGIPYTVDREGFFRGPYRLEERGRVVARATRQGFFRRSFQVTAGDRTLLLRQQGFFGSVFTVEHSRSGLGTIRREGLLKREAVATLDEKIALPCQVFLLFLAQVQWRSQSRRAA